ncbi:MAG: tyrosine-type recombinase/integrase [Gemmatimonadota bacterium]|jgi:integrase
MPRRAPLTPAAIRALPPRATRYAVPDGTVKGLQLRVSPNGVKTWSFKYRPKGQLDAPELRRTLGEYPALGLTEARREAEALRSKVTLGHDLAPPAPPPPALTVADALAEVLEDRAHSAAPATITEYERLARDYIRPTFGALALGAVTPAAVRKWHRALKGTPFVANRALALLGMTYSYARDQLRAIRPGDEPTRGCSPHPEDPRTRYLTPDEVKRLADTLERAKTTGLPPAPNRRRTGASSKHHAVHGRRYGPLKKATTRKVAPGAPLPAYPVAVAAIRFLLLSGWRKSEALGLEWAHVNMDAGVVVLPRTKRGRHVERILAPPALAILRTVATYRVASNAFVFPSAVKARAPIADLDRLWFAVRHAAGLEDVRLHDLRHSFASFAISHGVPLAIVGRLLDHKRSDTTQRYAHLLRDPLQDAAATTAAALTAAMGDPAPVPPAVVVALDARRKRKA